MKKTLQKSIITFNKLDAYEQVVHFVSTRKGGVSKSPYDKLNFSLHVEDNKKDVLKNRQVLADEAGIALEDFVLMKQIHSGNVHVATKDDRGKGTSSHVDALDGVDALITNEGGVCLAVLVADCVPILLYDPDKKAIAVIHAGWRGTMKRIAQNTVEKMKNEYGCNPENIIAGIGPSIGPCCYEATDQVLINRWRKFYTEPDEVLISKKRKTYLNLWQANKFQLMRMGVKEKNIEISGICTGCNTDQFYSYKREGVTGRFAAGMMLSK